jgi:predicted translin family RNA/ssDNA-binding protein
MMKPRPPYQYRSPADAVTSLLDLTDLAASISLSEDQRQKAYESSRKVQACLVQARAAVESGAGGASAGGEAAQAALSEHMAVILSTSETAATPNRTPRQANLSNRVEDHVRLTAYQHFLETGKLMKLPVGVTDEEYLGGACMGLAQDLGRYGLGRATARDVASVQIAANLTGQILEFLLQLDFRNGPLRRKYDGTKYSLKSLETLLYELTITGGGVAASDGSVDGDNDSGDAVMKQEDAVEVQADGQPPAHKRAKTLQLLPMDDLEALQLRMVHRDELREALIKKSRDGQKAAKQSIFALHRGDPEKALELLQQCHECILQQLLPIVQEEPPLRNGCFANVLEEYVEAKMFMTWLYGKDSISAATTTVSNSSSIDIASGVVLLPADFDIHLEPEEYLGGLCDLTGEVGRYAVQRGTARDVRGVQLCLQTNSDIYTALQSLERLPGGNGMNKKLDTVRQSVWKLERMLYEMSLSEAAGGRAVQTNSMEISEEKGESQD